MRDRLRTLAIFALSFGLSACSAGTQQPSQPALPPSGHSDRPMDTLGGIGGARLTTLLGDASPVLNGQTLTHFTIGVREVDAVSSGQIVPLATFTSPQSIDLLAYQNGNALNVGDAAVPAQSFDHVRLVVDTANASAVFADGTSLPVSFMTNSSSASSSGAGAATTTTPDANPGAVDVTMPLAISLASGSAQTVQLDFNVLESIAVINNNGVKVRPVAFGAPSNGAGMVTGTVVNSSGAPVQNAVVAAIASDGSIGNTAGTDSGGNFNLHALKAGSYNLVIYNAYTNAAGQKITASGQSSSATSVSGPSVLVNGGSKTSVGTIAD